MYCWMQGAASPPRIHKGITLNELIGGGLKISQVTADSIWVSLDASEDILSARLICDLLDDFMLWSLARRSSLDMLTDMLWNSLSELVPPKNGLIRLSVERVLGIQLCCKKILLGCWSYWSSSSSPRLPKKRETQLQRLMSKARRILAHCYKHRPNGSICMILEMICHSSDNSTSTQNTSGLIKIKL